MRSRWLAGQGEATEIVVVFGGWAAGAAPLTHLCGGRDVLFVWDWRDLDAGLPLLAGYRRRYLVAWSFGVAAYAHWQEGRSLGFERRVAICGSPVPVDRRLGIPPMAFARTRDRVSREVLAAFLDQAGVAPLDAPDIAALREELDAVAARGAAPPCDWDAAVVASRDHVFPAANLQRAFARVPTHVVDAPHAPFGLWRDWDEVLV